MKVLLNITKIYILSFKGKFLKKMIEKNEEHLSITWLVYGFCIK